MIYFIKRKEDLNVRRSLTYPKDHERKTRETIRQLKNEVSRLRKRERILMDELNNVMKPVRQRKEHVEEKSPKKMTQEEWRSDFMRRFKPELEKRLEELDKEEKDNES